ncbi:MAG: hypothetical protein M3R54_03475 [Chloroflexota bacterium]|nr:hypothetical protein [Chloroflexota bacterium]
MTKWFTAFPAAAAAVGAYYVLASAVLVLTAPFRFSLPIYGHAHYPPEITILALATGIGAIGAGAITYAYGGRRALAIVVALYLAIAATVVAPLAMAPVVAWFPPADIEGLTTPVVLLFSVLTAVPGFLIGVAVGARFALWRGMTESVVRAAGVYYVVCVVMSLPTPQLDLRQALPYTASSLSDGWRLAVLIVPALAAGLALPRDLEIWKGAAVGAFIALLGEAVGEIARLSFGGPYVPLSLVGVPFGAAATITAALVARRAVARRFSRSAWSPLAAVLAGAVLTLSAVGAWSLLGAIPTSYDRNVRVDGYRDTGDERKIVACITAGRGEELLVASAREDATRVALTVRLRRPPSWYFSDLVGILLPVVISLHDPVGQRAVVDASTGEHLRGVTRGGFDAVGFGC